MSESASLTRRVGACAGSMAFLYQMESCMTATALPVMTREVAGLSGIISLVPAAYLVAATVAMVPAGRLAVRIGFPNMLAAALATMALGTLICWLAPNALALLAGRWIEGLGGGAMASAAYGLIAACIPADQRRAVLGWVSLGAGAGMVAGTPLGGWLAGWLGWRALFGLQVPFLAVAAMLMARVNFGMPSKTSTPLGWGGSLILGFGAVCACVAGSLGRERGWASPEILALQGAALATFAGFIWSERRSATPLFPAGVWKAKNFWPYWSLLFFCAAAMGGSFFLLPFYLSDVMGLSAGEAAGWMIVQVTGYSLAAGGAGRLQKKLTERRQALLGVTLSLAGTLIFALGGAKMAGFAGIAVGCALIGGGYGLIFPAVNAGCVARLPEAFRGVAASLLPLGINLGSVAGVIATAEIREWQLAEISHRVYAESFLVILVALALSGLGFWRQREMN